MNSVRAGVAHCAAGNDREQIGFRQRTLFFRFVVFPDQLTDFQQMPGALLNFGCAQLDFEKGITSVLQVEHGIGFKSVPVAVIRELAA